MVINLILSIYCIIFTGKGCSITSRRSYLVNQERSRQVGYGVSTFSSFSALIPLVMWHGDIRPVQNLLQLHPKVLFGWVSSIWRKSGNESLCCDWMPVKPTFMLEFTISSKSSGFIFGTVFTSSINILPMELSASVCPCCYTRHSHYTTFNIKTTFYSAAVQS